MNFDNNQPIYIQIADFLKGLIVRGDLSPGDQAPSVRSVATDLKVNPNTVQRAYQLLQDEEIFFAKRGLGSFVSEEENIVECLKEDMAMDIFKSFIEEINKLGLSKDSTIILLKKYWEEYYDSDK